MLRLLKWDKQLRLWPIAQLTGVHTQMILFDMVYQAKVERQRSCFVITSWISIHQMEAGRVYE